MFSSILRHKIKINPKLFPYFVFVKIIPAPCYCKRKSFIWEKASVNSRKLWLKLLKHFWVMFWNEFLMSKFQIIIWIFENLLYAMRQWNYSLNRCFTINPTQITKYEVRSFLIKLLNVHSLIRFFLSKLILRFSYERILRRQCGKWLLALTFLGPEASSIIPTKQNKIATLLVSFSEWNFQGKGS